MIPLAIEKIYIEKDARAYELTEKICRQINAPAQVVDRLDIVFSEVLSALDPVQKGKSILCLTKNKGPFLKKCPGTSTYTCCGYKILHIGTFCFMDCSYCILQTYFHPPLMQFFVNHETLEKELADLFKQGSISRIGTGEFTDSMIWENWTGLSKLLVDKFSRQSRAVLELKTKTVAIDGLEGLNHNRKTIMSWSLNTEKVIHDEERGTAPLSVRLKAASKCMHWGYPLAFHFDPLVLYDHCEADYCAVIDQLFNQISPDQIVWISLGTFRYMPALKQIIMKRFKRSKIPFGEFIPGLDGKMRYFKPLRIKLYRKIVQHIRSRAPGVTVYFCMEDDEVWQESLGFIPEEKGGLAKLLDDSAVEKCGLDKSAIS